MSVYCIINQTMRLSDPTRKVNLAEPLAYSNQRAHAFRVTVLAEGSDDPADLTGIGVTAAFMRVKSNDTVTPIIGTVTGNVAEVVLPASCYNVVGRFTLTVDLSMPTDPTGLDEFDATATYAIGDRVAYGGNSFVFKAVHTGAWDAADVYAEVECRTALWVEGIVEKNTTESIIDPGTPVANYTEVINSANAAASSAISAAAQATSAAAAARAVSSIYETQMSKAFAVRKDYAITSLGRYGTNHPESVGGYAGDSSPKVTAGDTFTVKEGYTFSYSVWSVPFTSSTSTDYRLEMTRNIAAGTTVTIANGGYLGFSAAAVGGGDIPATTSAEDFIDAAVSCNVFLGTIADEVKRIDEEVDERYGDVQTQLAKTRTISMKTPLYKAQKDVADDWHFPLIDALNGLGLGANHQIPGTKTIWSQSGTTDLNQKGIWMSDGTHPYRGVGLVDMFGRGIANQLALISPSYHDGAGQSDPSYWAGKRLLWMGTSIPAGSDPEAGDGDGATYPQMVATQLGATSINIARGSSMVRIAASTGEWGGITYSHFLRSLSRTIAEADVIAADWDNIKTKIPGSNVPSSIPEADVAIMKGQSYETLLMPYLDGTNTAPDLFVIDHGHNDGATGSDGERDWWVAPTLENIASGLLAEDTYMTANSYANLKTAMNNDLTGISDIAAFAASVNRNCFQGAMNYLITMILRYQPYARIVIVSDYN